MADGERMFAYSEDALRYGTYMGLFWIVKFSFIPLGFGVMPVLQLLFVLCTLFVPVLGYLFVRKYRNKYNEGDFPFLKAFHFTALMYLAAILLVAVAHYVYFKYMDHGYLVDCYQQQIQAMKEVYKGADSALVDNATRVADMLGTLTPMQMVTQLLTQNVFYCVLLSALTALCVMKRKYRNI